MSEDRGDLYVDNYGRFLCDVKSGTVIGAGTVVYNTSVHSSKLHEG